MKALLDMAVRDFHYRQSLDACVTAIARLDSYEKCPTSKRDTPVKIRQDLLATGDVISLALHLRRFAEITHSSRLLADIQVAGHALSMSGGRVHPEMSDVSLEKLVGQVMHSNTCVVCRNGVHLCLHFGLGRVPKALVDGDFATKSILVVESDRPKRFFFLREVLEAAWSLIASFLVRNKEVADYLKRRI